MGFMFLRIGGDDSPIAPWSDIYYTYFTPGLQVAISLYIIVSFPVCIVYNNTYTVAQSLQSC